MQWLTGGLREGLEAWESPFHGNKIGRQEIPYLRYLNRVLEKEKEKMGTSTRRRFP
jgi:hypothetical protein